MKIYHVNQSPFYKEKHHEKYIRGEQGVKVSFRIPKTAYNDLMTYFKGNGWNSTDGFNHILTEKLNSINTSKRTCFNNIELLMLIPNSSDIMELNEKSVIIGLYNADFDFKKDYNYVDGFKKGFNIVYERKFFCEDFFPIDIINSLKDSPLVDVDKKDIGIWDSLYQKLEELYDIDLNNAFFVRFPLNNYLDVNRDGQYQDLMKEGFHKGIYVFNEFGGKSLYCVLTWNYLNQMGEMSLDFKFIHMMEFMRILSDSNYKPLNDARDGSHRSFYDKKELKRLIDDEERHLAHLKKLYDSR